MFLSFYFSLVAYILFRDTFFLRSWIMTSTNYPAKRVKSG